VNLYERLRRQALGAPEAFGPSRVGWAPFVSKGMAAWFRDGTKGILPIAAASFPQARCAGSVSPELCDEMVTVLAGMTLCQFSEEIR